MLRELNRRVVTSRSLRIEFEGALYHVTTRGDRGETIFDDDTDRSALRATIAQAMGRFDATTFAHFSMGMHHHLVLSTQRPNLSRLMRYINGIYAQIYSRRHPMVGHLFQGRIKEILVDRNGYVLEVCRYVDLNPVRATVRPVWH